MKGQDLRNEPTCSTQSVTLLRTHSTTAPASTRVFSYSSMTQLRLSSVCTICSRTITSGRKCFHSSTERGVTAA